MADIRKLIQTGPNRDTLRSAFPILNMVIDSAVESATTANEAKAQANNAAQTANEANAKSDSTQEQLNTIVIKGDSSVEAAQARVSNSEPVPKTFPTLKNRMDYDGAKLEFVDYEINSRTRKKQGITVFISDDARIEDYNILKPIFESENVPLCCAVIAERYRDSENFMSWTQLHELEDMGWEIMSHSANHNEPVGTPDMTDEQAEYEYRDSKRILLEQGFNVQSYMVPGGLYNTRERLLSKKYYRASRVSSGGYENGLNHSPINTHELKTMWLDPTSNQHSDDVNYYKAQIDRAREENALLIISTHGQNINTVALQSLFTEVIQYAKQETLVTTLRDALNIFGNVMEIGDFSHNTGTRAPRGNYLAIGSEGEVSSNVFGVTMLPSNTFTPSTPYQRFPQGITLNTLDSSASGLPNGQPGTLITYKVHPVSEGFNFQEFHTFGTNSTILRRGVLAGGTFENWQVLNARASNYTDTFSLSTTYSQLPRGIYPITIDSTKSANAPEGKPGILMNYKVASGDRYNFQEYHIYSENKVYRRSVIAGPSFGEWVLVTPYNVVKETSHNQYDCTTLPSAFPKGVTYTTTNNTTGTPSNKAGTLIMHNLYSVTGGYMWQEFHPYASTEVYKRYVVDGNTYSTWAKVSV